MTEHDELVVDLAFGVPGRLTEASVHYRAFIRNRWVEVSRYDNAHGAPHRHRFWQRGPARPLRPTPAPSAMVDAAKADFKLNLPKYRRFMEAKQG